eukprot:TRINITY_DN11460_c0_g1_i1.p1 TRINITY_DN11460_c0_g1~~TRINITY_DN11460_c0_g1_i1.p1  ORF type:complete len:280 (+),score=16.22 TRINITY_DN11460_c0_g1_i1:3-842(+)
MMCVGAAHAYTLDRPFAIRTTSGSVGQVTVDGNGRFFALATDTLQFYDAEGALEVDSQKVCSSGYGNIAVSMNSEYAIAAQTGYPNGIYARFFDTEAYGPPFLVSSFDINYRVSDPSVAASATASLVAWGTPQIAPENEGILVNLMFFTPLDGVPIGDRQVALFPPAIRFDVKVSVAPLVTPHSFLVFCLHDSSISAVMTDWQGSMGNYFTVNDGGAADNFAVASGPNSILVVWGITEGPNAGQVRGQFVGSGGRIGGNFEIAVNNAMNPSITATATGC